MAAMFIRRVVFAIVGFEPEALLQLTSHRHSVLGKLRELFGVYG
jgi:hypothetical protein